MTKNRRTQDDSAIDSVYCYPGCFDVKRGMRVNVRKTHRIGARSQPGIVIGFTSDYYAIVKRDVENGRAAKITFDKLDRA